MRVADCAIARGHSNHVGHKSAFWATCRCCRFVCVSCRFSSRLGMSRKGHNHNRREGGDPGRIGGGTCVYCIAAELLGGTYLQPF
jgi:hypothetical protein